MVKNDPKLISLEIPIHWKIKHHQWFETNDAFLPEDLFLDSYE